MSLDWLGDVRQFMERFEFTVSEQPTQQPEKVRAFREALISEEVSETLEALKSGDLVELADGIADAIYVLLGTAVSYGLNIRPVWDEVHRSNMAKLPGEKTGDGTKPLKPEGWLAPQVEKCLNSQTGYDLIAKEYFDDRHRTCRNFDRATAQTLLNSPVRLSKPIIEVGAGRGRCLEFTGRCADVQVDSSIEMLNLYPREPATRIHADAHNLRMFPDNCFASLVGFLCDPFLDEIFLKEAHRVVSDRILLTTPAYEWGHNLRMGRPHNETVFKTISGREVTVPSMLYTEEQLKQMASNSGFKVVSFTKCTLPESSPVSPAVSLAAERASIDPYKLPIVYILVASKS
jgi:predicted HAD superfamily Cof-like phosphohydrolase